LWQLEVQVCPVKFSYLDLLIYVRNLLNLKTAVTPIKTLITRTHPILAFAIIITVLHIPAHLASNRAVFALITRKVLVLMHILE